MEKSTPSKIVVIIIGSGTVLVITMIFTNVLSVAKLSGGN